jgi:hypothetical protein
MPTFKSPVYSKKTTNGQTEASYVFSVEYSDLDDGIGFVADSVEDISVQSVQRCLNENQEWWNHYLQDFLRQSTKFFSKQYTVQNLLKIIRHTIQDVVEVSTPTNVILLPKHIQILGGTFIIHWNYTCQSIAIDIPGLSDSLPVLNKVIDGVAELNMNDLPIDSTESFDLEDPNRLYEKQKVKEAILRAKVAYYKAQNQIRTFSDKYGEEYSSEFELEDTENESDDEDEDEEEDEEEDN